MRPRCPSKTKARYTRLGLLKSLERRERAGCRRRQACATYTCLLSNTPPGIVLGPTMQWTPRETTRLGGENMHSSSITTLYILSPRPIEEPYMTTPEREGKRGPVDLDCQKCQVLDQHKGSTGYGRGSNGTGAQGSDQPSAHLKSLMDRSLDGTMGVREGP